MAPTKSKAKKTKGAAIVATQAKRTGKAGKKKQASANTAQGQHLRVAEEVASLVQDDIGQKLDGMMKTMADLSGQMRDLSGQVEAHRRPSEGGGGVPMQPDHLSPCQEDQAPVVTQPRPRHG